MDRSVDDWIIQLRARFARSPIDAEDDADRCKFSFAQDNRMDLRTYLTRKQNLLVEARVEDPRQIMQRVRRDLDPILQITVHLDPYMPLEVFIQRLYLQEYAARQLWNSMQNMVRRPTQEYGPVNHERPIYETS